MRHNDLNELKTAAPAVPSLSSRRHSLPAINCRLHASSTNQHITLQRDWEDIETSHLKSQLELLRLNGILPTAMSADSQGSDAEDVKGILGKRDKRTSRACLTCRKRKSACELSLVDGVVTPPCKRCKATGLECVIGSSNRGGRRVRRKTTHDDTTDVGNNGESSMLSNLDEDVRPGALRGDYSLDQAQADGTSSLHHPPTPGIVLDPALQNTEPSFATRESSTTSNMFGGHELQNPSDALGILAQIASHSNGDNPHPYSMMQQQPMKDYQPAMHYGHNSLEYPLVRDGRLSVSKVIQLLQRYKMYYHPYFPLVPSATLDAGNLAKTAREEPHLLTAVLVVASRDLVDDPNVFTACTEYMRSLVSATGKQRAFVSNSERDNPAPPSQTRGHRGLPGANSAAPENEKDSTSEPILATIFERFALFDISGLTESLTKIIVPSWVLALPAALHKLQDEMSLAPWSVSWEIWEQAHDPQINPEIVWDASVRISNDLCLEERQYLQKRKPNIAKALARYLDVPESEVHPDDVPVIAMCGSGGGLRAMVAGTSSYLSAQQDGLFDCATYTAGVSGSCWLQTLYYSSIGQTSYGRLIDHFKERLGVHIAFPQAALNLLSQAPTNKFLLSGIVEKLKGVPNAEFGLVDIYGTLLAARLLVPKGELRVSDWDLKISNQRYFVDDGDQPLPIYAAVRHEIPMTPQDRRESLPDAERPTSKNDYFQWFEWTPYEFFSEELSAGIPTWAVGREFNGGQNVMPENGLFLPEIKIPLMLVGLSTERYSRT